MSCRERDPIWQKKPSWNEYLMRALKPLNALLGLAVLTEIGIMLYGLNSHWPIASGVGYIQAPQSSRLRRWRSRFGCQSGRHTDCEATPLLRGLRPRTKPGERS
jgi:hypothetical protein